MAHKHVLFQSEARAKVLKGASLLADAVRVTLGPKSKSVLIQKKWGKPIVCNDGVTIAKEIELKDPEENLGAQMLREAAEKTGDAVGDGTSTSTLLAHAIYTEGLRNVEAGASAVDLKRGLDFGLVRAVEAIRKLSKPVQTIEEKIQVAAISAHNDEKIGSLVAQAIDKVGAEGVVTVEEAKGTETSIDVVEGLQFDRGYLSGYFVTDMEKMETVLEKPVLPMSSGSWRAALAASSPWDLGFPARGAWSTNFTSTPLPAKEPGSGCESGKSITETVVPRNLRHRRSS